MRHLEMINLIVHPLKSILIKNLLLISPFLLRTEKSKLQVFSIKTIFIDFEIPRILFKFFKLNYKCAQIRFQINYFFR